MMILDVIFLMIISFGLLWVLATLIDAFIAKRRRYKSHAKPPCLTICHKCKYLNHNIYIKCALNPALAMTEQAVDCVDFWPKT
jgi:hypothetical protein